MMQSNTNISNEDSSSVSYSATGSYEGRYKKALKQISKMVSVNISLKRQIQQWKQNYNRLDDMYQDVVIKYNGMVSKISQKTAEFGQPTDQQFKRSDFQDEQGQNFSFKNNKDVYYDKENLSSNDNSKLGNNNQKQLLQQKIAQFQNLITKLEDKNNQKEDIIHELHLALEKKHAQIIQLQGKNGDLSQQLNKLKNAPKAIPSAFKSITPTSIPPRQNPFTLSTNQELIRQKKKVQQLQQKLQKEQDWSRHVQSQYQQMRKSLIMFPQSSSYQLQNKICNQSMIQFNSVNTSSSFIERSNSKKGSSREYDIQKIKKEYAQKKSKYKSQISKLKQQITQLNERIVSMNIFIQKQQDYIQKFSSQDPRLLSRY